MVVCSATPSPAFPESRLFSARMVRHGDDVTGRTGGACGFVDYRVLVFVWLVYPASVAERL